MLLSSITSVALAASGAFASVLPRQQPTFPVTGPTGGLQPRLEIDQLMQNADQWNIYLLGFARFKAVDRSDPRSYYQIAGIHGQPNEVWDGAQRCDNCTGIGYCPHESTIFTTWHRIYLTLFEQQLQFHALAAAAEFPAGEQRDRYTNAATNLRLPYWNWAQTLQPGQPAFHQAFTVETVSVTSPTGQQTIPNPLVSYTFGDPPRNWGFQPTSQTTLRDPRALDAGFRRQIRADTWVMLSTNTTFNSFSSSALLPGDNNPSSLESVHNSMHGAIGGDMGGLPSASFEPAFWFHHNFIEYLFAVWQTANPDQWLTPAPQVGSSSVYAPGTILSGSSPLTPFHSNNARQVWTSDAIRDSSRLNYVWADLAGGREAAIRIINSFSRNAAAPQQQQQQRGRNAKRQTSPTETQEYVASLRADLMRTNGSFAVYISAGPLPSTDPSTWFTATNLLCEHFFFSDRNTSTSANMGLDQEHCSMTDGLLAQVSSGALSNTTTQAVKPFLRENMRVQLVRLDGYEVIGRESVPEFAVDVLTARVVLPVTDTELPIWGSFETVIEGA